MNNFSFSGHSGFKVVITNNGLVKKSSFDEKSSLRLQNQYEKQLNFISDNDFIKPEIINSGLTDNCFYFEMEMIQFTDFISYFETANKNHINYIANKFIKFIDNNIKNSNFSEISSEVIIKKYNSISDCLNDYQREKILELINLHPTYILPIGFCHGDLTLSNVLFDSEERKICLIDFLDNFIETPLNDIVKLRQDTKYKWSFHLYNSSYDFVKMETILDYLDKKIDDHFQQNFFYSKYYHIFELINLVRVLKYAQSSDIKTFLHNLINKSINDLHYTSSRQIK